MEESYRQKFYDKYIKEVLPKMIFLEPERKKKLRSFWLTQISCLVIFLFCIIYYIKTGLISLDYGNAQTFNLIIYFFIVPFFAFITIVEFCMYKRKLTNFKRLLKINCIPLFYDVFDNFSWSTLPKVKLHFDRSNLFGNYNEINYCDTFHSKYGKVTFDIQEVELIHEGYFCNNTIFKGVVIQIPSNKTIKSNTIVTTKNDINIKNRHWSVLITAIPFLLMCFVDFSIVNFILSLFCALIIIFMLYISDLNNEVISALRGVRNFKQAFEILFQNLKLSKVNLEDINFNKKFLVQSQDQIEARYLVTSIFMERLQNLQTAFGTKNIKCSFFEDKIMFAIPTKKDLFEIGDLFTPLEKSKHINKFFEEIISIYGMIDYFKLNERTGL